MTFLLSSFSHFTHFHLTFFCTSQCSHHQKHCLPLEKKVFILDGMRLEVTERLADIVRAKGYTVHTADELPEEIHPFLKSDHVSKKSLFQLYFCSSPLGKQAHRPVTCLLGGPQMGHRCGDPHHPDRQEDPPSSH